MLTLRKLTISIPYKYLKSFKTRVTMISSSILKFRSFYVNGIVYYVELGDWILALNTYFQGIPYGGYVFHIFLSK